MQLYFSFYLFFVHSASEMTYIVSGGALNSTHSFNFLFTVNFMYMRAQKTKSTIIQHSKWIFTRFPG